MDPKPVSVVPLGLGDPIVCFPWLHFSIIAYILPANGLWLTLNIIGIAFTIPIGSVLLRNEWQDFTQLSSATPSNTSDFLLQGGHSDLLP